MFPSTVPPRHPAPRHKIFVSFHHADWIYKDLFIRQYQEHFDDYSVRDGDIPENLPTEHVRQLIRDDYIRDATVTVILVGQNTWKRKHVDWEIYSGLRDTKLNSRTGLLGILLPTYRLRYKPTHTTTPARAEYHLRTIPPRLWDNIAIDYATMRPWPANPWELRDWIHSAFVRRDQNPPPNCARDLFGRNRPDEQDHWSE